MDEVIPKFPEHEQNDLKLAAEQWRLPYWDWAMKKPIYDTDPVLYDYDVPQLTRLEAVKIRVPGGLKWVKNPLHAFRMPKNAPMSNGKVSNVVKTEDNPEIHVRPLCPHLLLEILILRSSKLARARVNIHRRTNLPSEKFRTLSLKDTKIMTQS